MQHAPSVSYPVGRFVGERRLAHVLIVCLLCWGVTGIGVMAWRWLVGDPSASTALWSMVCWSLAVVVWGAWVLRAQRRAPVGLLQWTMREGEPLWEWVTEAQVMAVRVHVRLDLGQWLWLCLKPAMGPSVWVWAQAASDSSQWRPFRRAVRRCTLDHQV